MKTSDTVGAIAKALSAFQSEVGNASKSKENPFFHSKYADLGEVLNTVRPLLGKNGLSLAQFPSFEGSDQGGIVMVTSLLGHESGEWFSCETTAPVFPTTGKSGKTELVSAQTVGSAITYCRRYAAAAILGIGQEDDDGNATSGKDSNGTATGNTPPPPEKPKPIGWTPAETQEWNTLMDKVGSHLRVQNKLDDLEAFVGRVTASKALYPPAILLPQLRSREKEFAAQAEAFVTAPEPEPLVQIDLL